MTTLAFALLIGFLGFVYFEPSLLFPGLAGVKLPLGMAVSALIMSLAAGARPLRAPGTPPLLALLALGLLSLLFAPVKPELGFLAHIWTTMKVSVLYFTVLGLARTPPRLKKFLLANVAMAVVMAGGSLLAVRSGVVPLTGGKLSRMSNYFGGIGDNTNEMGLVMLPFVAICLSLVRAGRPVALNLAAFGCTALFVLSTIRTRSRGAFVGLLVIVSFYLWDHRRDLRRVAVVAVAALAVFVHVQSGFWNRMSTIASQTAISSDFNAYSRVIEYGHAIELIRRYPVLGVGLGNYIEAKKQVLHVEPYRDGLYYAQHNAYLAVGSEMGVFALIAYLFLVLGTIRRLGRGSGAGAVRAEDPEDWPRPALKYALSGMAAALFFLTEWFNVVFFILLAAAQVVISSDRSRPAPPDQPAGPLPVDQPGHGQRTYPAGRRCDTFVPRMRGAIQ